MSFYKFKPYNVGRWLIWSLFAIVLLCAPLVFTSNLAGTILAQMGIAIIACLSYNILLGQGGMLSFGHAVYTGLGSFVAIHALNTVTAGQINIPVTLIPLVGGLSGIGFAVLLGYVTTKKAGTPFAMITLGVAELVFAMSLMFSEFFGGEAGISGNRVVGQAVWGITFGPQIQIYYLIAIYTFICVALMYAFTQTPLGRILNAVRDNPERRIELQVVNHFNHGTRTHQSNQAGNEKAQVTNPYLFEFSKRGNAQVHHDEAGNSARRINHHNQEQESQIKQPGFGKFRQKHKSQDHQNTTNNGAKKEGGTT